MLDFLLRSVGQPRLTPVTHVASQRLPSACGALCAASHDGVPCSLARCGQLSLLLVLRALTGLKACRCGQLADRARASLSGRRQAQQRTPARRTRSVPIHTCSIARLSSCAAGDGGRVLRGGSAGDVTTVCAAAILSPWRLYSQGSLSRVGSPRRFALTTAANRTRRSCPSARMSSAPCAIRFQTSLRAARFVARLLRAP